TAQKRRDHERRPESHPSSELVGQIRAEHENAGMREVEHAHHAEDQREPAGEHEQQEAVDHAVQERNGGKLEHALRRGCLRSRSARSMPRQALSRGRGNRLEQRKKVLRDLAWLKIQATAEEVDSY